MPATVPETLAASAVATWIAEDLLPDDIAASYSYLVPIKGSMPDVSVRAVASRKAAEDREWFPELSAMHEAWVLTVELEITFGVEVDEANAPAAQAAATEAAQRLIERLIASTRDGIPADATAGDRLDPLEDAGGNPASIGTSGFVSPRFDAELEEPFVQWDDGSRGLVGTCRAAVGWLVPDPS